VSKALGRGPSETVAEATRIVVFDNSVFVGDDVVVDDEGVMVVGEVVEEEEEDDFRRDEVVELEEDGDDVAVSALRPFRSGRRR
jgi:hypothetical protein